MVGTGYAEPKRSRRGGAVMPLVEGSNHEIHYYR